MRFKDLHPNIKIRMVVQFFGGLAMMAVMPYLAIYFAGKVGETLTGLMFLITIIVGVIGGFIGGFYADRIGRRKMMIGAEAVILGTFVLITLVNSPWLESPYLTFFLFVINMFFSGLFGPAAQAMIIDVSNSENRKYIFGISYWAMNLANMIGGIIGAFLFKEHLFELYIGVSVISLISLLTTIFFIKETYQPSVQQNVETVSNITDTKQKKQNPILQMFKSYSTVLRDKTFMIYILVSLFVLSLEHQLSNYIGIRLSKEMSEQSLLPTWSPFSLNVDGVKMLGFLRAENTLLVVLAAVLVTRLMKRFADKKVMIFGIFIFTIGYFVLGVSNAPWILLAAMFVVTIGELMWVPIKQAYLGDIAPSDARSSYMAVNSLTGSGAMIIGAVFISLGGWVSSWVMGSMFLILGFSSILMLVKILPDLHSRREQHEKKEVVQATNSTSLSS